jgi:phosphoribosylformylglycinamidine synthase subunit PurS
MKFLAKIQIMPKKELLDPQGKTVTNNLKNIGILNLSDVRIGKNVECIIEADSEAEAIATANAASSKLLANIIMEDFSIELVPLP